MRAEFATISRSRNPRISRERDVVRRWRVLSRGRRTYNFLASLSQNLRAAAINWIILRLARGFLNRVFLLFSLPIFFLPLLLFLFYRARLWKPRASGCVFFPPRDFFEREKARHFVRHFLPPPPPPFSSFFVAFLFKIYRGVRRANLIKKVSGRKLLPFSLLFAPFFSRYEHFLPLPLPPQRINKDEKYRLFRILESAKAADWQTERKFGMLLLLLLLFSIRRDPR